MNMEKIVVDKNRLSELISFSDVVISLNNRIYGRCSIDCRRCQFFYKGCYYRMNEIREVQEMYREEVILNWLKGD